MEANLWQRREPEKENPFGMVETGRAREELFAPATLIQGLTTAVYYSSDVPLFVYYYSYQPAQREFAIGRVHWTIAISLHYACIFRPQDVHSEEQSGRPAGQQWSSWRQRLTTTIITYKKICLSRRFAATRFCFRLLDIRRKDLQKSLL